VFPSDVGDDHLEGEAFGVGATLEDIGYTAFGHAMDFL
jgi:hypothetical protein